MGTELEGANRFTSEINREVFYDYLVSKIDEAMSNYLSGIAFPFGTSVEYLNFDTLDEFVDATATLGLATQLRENLFDGLGDAVNYLIAALNNIFQISRNTIFLTLQLIMPELPLGHTLRVLQMQESRILWPQSEIITEIHLNY